MAFWGVQVKPGKSFVHSSKGRLRITQATLGIGNVSKTTTRLQCNVGTRTPVLVCSLIPNKVESCKLDLEFEEECDVTFSVIGPLSIYLTGYYYIRNCDTESLGIDNEEYGSKSEEGNNFTDDSDLQVYAHSDFKGNKKSKPSKYRCSRLKKKYLDIESGDEVSMSNKSSDEDGYLFSIFNKKNKPVK